MASPVESIRNQLSPAVPPEGLLAEKFYVLDNIKFSVLQSEEHQRKGRLTLHPMENGVQVSDHFITEPEVITARFEQTNVMYSSGNPFTDYTTQDLLNVSYEQVNLAHDYCKKVYNDLKTLFDTHTLFTLITFHETYDNVILTSISALHRAPYKGALQFTVQMQKAHLIDINTVDITPRNVTNQTLVPTQNNGTQKPTSVTSSTLGSIINLR